jgi:hypothetical protein
MENLHAMFQLPRSAEAFQQYLELAHELDNLLLELAHELDSLIPTGENDLWTYIWGNARFSVRKTYKALAGHVPTHPVFQSLWASKCQPKHKVFFSASAVG